MMKNTCDITFVDIVYIAIMEYQLEPPLLAQATEPGWNCIACRTLLYILSLKFELTFNVELELLISKYFQTWVCGPGSTGPS
jgi:hypothetical protein